MGGTVDALSLGAACAFLGATYMFATGIMAWQWQWGVSLIEVISGFSPGYGPSPVGSLMGAMWGALDGFLAGTLLAGLYNRTR